MQPSTDSANTAGRVEAGGWLTSTVSALSRIGPFLEKLNWVSLAAVFGISLMTSVSAIMRYAFNKPILGDTELVEFIVIIAAFMPAAAVTQLHRRHVAIDLLLERASDKGKVVLQSITYFFAVIMFSLLAWRSFVYSFNSHVQYGGYTASARWPVAPFSMIVPIGCALLVIVLLRDFLGFLAEGRKLRLSRAQWLTILLVPVALLVFLAFAVQGTWQISSLTLGGIGLTLCVLVFFTGLPVSFVMFIMATVGIAVIRGLSPSLGFLGQQLWKTGGDYNFAVIPVFILMGFFIFYSDIGADLYNTAYKWIGGMRGGLASATIAASTVFGAVVGDTVTGTITMGVVALPEMRKYGYDDKLATGAICSGGTLGTLIPPSVPFAIYALITQNSIGAMFMAGILPGLLMAVAWMVQIYVSCRLNPKLGPAAPPTTWGAKFGSLKNTWPVLVLFAVVLGSIYAGVATVTEAGGLGAMGALIIGVAMRRITWQKFVGALKESGIMMGMAFIMIPSAIFLGSFFVVSNFPLAMATYLRELNVAPILIIWAIIVLLLFLGCFINTLPLMLVVVPIVYPVVSALGFSGIWFGVLVVMSLNLGALTPPFAINIFCLRVVVRDVPIGVIYRGVIPYCVTGAICIAIVVYLPQLATWLPSLMRIGPGG